MAFVTIPKDLSKVKTKVALNLTKRQLICFGAAAVLGIPAYIFTRIPLGNSAAALLMILVMFPLFFLGVFERDGIPAEIIMRDMIRTRFAWPGKRPYKTENLYEIMEKEAKDIADKQQIATAAKTQCASALKAKRDAGKGEQKRHKK